LLINYRTLHTSTNVDIGHSDVGTLLLLPFSSSCG